jgi:hypothetical protein
MANVFLTDSENTALKMHECGQDQYWFYHKGSYPNDSPLLYQELVDNATNEIIIWDPYFNIKSPNADQNIFANIQNNVTIKILTFKGLDRNQTYLTEVKNALKTIIPPTKDCRFGLRVINTGDVVNQGSRFFHDRFLIIDETKVFLVGSSVGYHVQSEQSTGIFKVSNPDTKEFIKSIFQYYWNNSTQHQIPLTFLHP